MDHHEKVPLTTDTQCLQTHNIHHHSFHLMYQITADNICCDIKETLLSRECPPLLSRATKKKKILHQK